MTQASEYKTALKPIWCSGCGNFGVLTALTRRVLPKLELPRHRTLIVSGIGCSSRVPAYVDTYGFNSIHGRALPIAQGAKLAKPDVIAFPSIQLVYLHGYLPEACPGGDRQQCFEDNYAALANLERDRFAVSSYPYLFGIDAPADLPADWFTRAGDRGSEPMVIAETGWIATDAVALHPNGCVTALASSPQEQAAYFERVVAAAESRRMDLLTWFSDEDVLPVELMTDCPCTFDASWCAVVDAFRASAGSDPVDQFFAELMLKGFGTMGLRERDGTPRSPIFDRWAEILALPVVPSI